VTDEKLEKSLAGTFEENRSHLRSVAYRMLGSLSDAEDAIQETWLRLSRSNTSGVDNLRGWLTTVVARVCLDMLRSRKARAEEDADEAAAYDQGSAPSNAEQEAVLAESVSLALLVVLGTLEPAERLAFVLHDLFDVPFEQIASILGRSEVAARQLASRARRRVRGAPERGKSDLAQQRDLVTRMLAALRAGDVEAVVAVLDPNVRVHAEGGDGTVHDFHSAREWASNAVVFARSARLFAAVEPALVDGAVGAIFAPGGRLARAMKVSFAAGAIASIDIISDPTRMKALEIAALD
jgi:RNA polymerase sigma-70 factor (ECF subfamily)